VECDQCANICELLTEIDESPLWLLQNGVSAYDAFSCSLCGACEAVCPQGLSPREIFAAGRKNAVLQNELDIDEYRYLFTDRKNSIMGMYRSYSGIDYSDLMGKTGAGTYFFPGCILFTYSPGLTRTVYRHLQTDCDCKGIWLDCCGKPLAQMGLPQRSAAVRDKLRAFLKEHQINKIIMACPGCYYEFKEIFPDIDVLTVYETLQLTPDFQVNAHLCTVHDACPDRFENRFGAQVRDILKKRGFRVTEMKHAQKETICCGSGGQISHFRPDLTEKLVNLRLAEAEESGATILASYCLSCVLKFGEKSPKIPATHVLNLLLKEKEDFKGAKDRARQMFEGSEGEKRWEAIMADADE
jgi:Fe-S oxidoreductase